MDEKRVRAGATLSATADLKETMSHPASFIESQHGQLVISILPEAQSNLELEVKSTQNFLKDGGACVPLLLWSSLPFSVSQIQLDAKGDVVRLACGAVIAAGDEKPTDPSQRLGNEIVLFAEQRPSDSESFVKACEGLVRSASLCESEAQIVEGAGGIDVGSAQPCRPNAERVQQKADDLLAFDGVWLLFVQKEACDRNAVPNVGHRERFAAQPRDTDTQCLLVFPQS